MQTNEFSSQHTTTGYLYIYSISGGTIDGGPIGGGSIPYTISGSVVGAWLLNN